MKIIIIITYYHPKRYQVFTPSLHEVQGSHTNISDKVYNQVSIRQPPPPPPPPTLRASLPWPHDRCH
jgi:hypothetical protein